MDAPGSRWRGLLRCGGWAAFASVGLTVIQIAVFAVWPPVHTVPEVFRLMVGSPVLGLLSLDLLYVLNNLAVWVLYVGLSSALWTASASGATLAVGLGTLQMAAYLASNPALEMLALARAHADAGPAARAALEAAGEAVLAGWKGTAFVVYYLLGAAVLLIFAWLLRRSPLFAGATAWWALAAGVLMLVPSTFGAVGMVMSLGSLLPWGVFAVLAGRTLLRLATSLPR